MRPPRLEDEDDLDEDLDEHRHTKRRRKVSDTTESEVEDAVLMHKRWRNRRRMAWLSLIAMFSMTYCVFFTDLVSIERMQVLKEVVTWFYFACISIVGAYMGFTTWASKK